VSAGPAVVGNVGSERRLEYTVVGDPVNQAARLCELAKTKLARVLASATILAEASVDEAARWHLGGDSLLRGPPAPTAAPARGSSRIWDPVLRDKPMLFLLAAAMRATARRTSRSVARPCAAAQMQTSTQATRSVPAAVFQALSPPPRARSTPATAMDPAMAVHMASRGLAGVRRRFTVRGFRGGGV
jgi:hypothetical protein